MCGLAGFLLSARLGSAEAVAGSGFELAVIAAVVIGGTSLFGGVGGIFGTVVGVLLIGVLTNGLVLIERVVVRPAGTNHRSRPHRGGRVRPVRDSWPAAGSLAMSEYVLDLQGISQHFGAIQALTGVDLALSRGEVLGLMGDNGAGKSTLVKIIAGNFPPSGGTILLDGEKVHFHSPLDARRHGVEIVYQDLALCDNLTASLNVFMGRELTRGIGPFRVLDRGAMVRRAGELFAELKSETRPRIWSR